MKVGCLTGGPVGSQVREFLQWAGGDMCVMPRGRGDWRPMSSGADVSRTQVDRGRGQGRSCHHVWVMPIEEASLQRQNLGKTVAICRCGLLCCKPLVEEYQFKGSWNVGSSA